MKKLLKIKLVIIALFTLTINSCSDVLEGNGQIVTQELLIENFTGFNVTGSINVKIIESDELEVYATGDSNIVDIISNNVSNGIWDIRLTNNNVGNFDLEIEIYSPDLNSIKTNGSSTVDIESINSESGNLDLNLIGAGKVRSLGMDTLENLSIQVNGSASTELFNLNVNNCTIDVSGSGNQRVFVNNSLDITVSGSSNIYYRGTPSINSSISGSGTIINDN